MDTIINLDNVSFSYTQIPVVRDITLGISEGEFLGVIGPNAGGKSTLLKLILGLLEPDKGDIKVFGKSPDRGRSRIGYVPQYPAFSRDFPINVRDAVLLGRLGETRWYGGYTRADKEIAMNSLKAVEIDNISNQTIDSLSGGQLQRVLIARALASKPDILILDEPTNHINFRHIPVIAEALHSFSGAMILVSHVPDFVEQIHIDETLDLDKSKK